MRSLQLAVLTTSISILPSNGHAQQSATTVGSDELNLMPMPASMALQPGRLKVTSAFNVATKGFVDDRLNNGISRMLVRLAGRTVLSLSYDRATDENTAALLIQVGKAGETIPSVREDESYRVEINEKQARL